MKRKGASDQEIASILKHAEAGERVEDICRRTGISRTTLYRWRKDYSGLSATEIGRMRALEEENGRLKKLVADLTLDREMLQELLRRKW